MMKDLRELSKEELMTIEGGGWLKDKIRAAADWVGEKLGQVSYVLSQMDWSGNYLGY